MTAAPEGVRRGSAGKRDYSGLLRTKGGGLPEILDLTMLIPLMPSV
jgi:hypothetical protein